MGLAFTFETGLRAIESRLKDMFFLTEKHVVGSRISQKERAWLEKDDRYFVLIEGDER